MSKITTSTDFDRVSAEDMPRRLNQFGEDVVAQVNGGLDFSTNFNASEVSVSFTAANTDTPIAHGLGRVPTRYILTGSTVALGLYDGSIKASSSIIYLKSSAVGTASILIY